MLSIKHLSLKYEDNFIFKDFSFEVKENTVTLLAGKSGSGKSSILMSIARVIPEIIEGNLTGDIFLSGESIIEKNAVEVSGKIAYLFQDPDSQLCTFKVEDEIAFGLENKNTPREDMDKLIDYYLEIVGIKDLRHRDITSLSGGQKQKVAIASVLAVDADILLMDEPTANLDPISRLEIVDLIEKLKNEYRKTILLVEHNVLEFEKIIDDVIYIFNDAKKIDKSMYFSKYKEEYLLPKKEILKKENDVILSVKNISFSYDNKNNILKNVSFDVKKGEIIGILGRNGTGKSTLTKILIGFYKNYKGDIFVKNNNLEKLSVKDLGKYVGLVFQNPEHQFIKLTVEKELSLSLEIQNKDDEYISSKTDEFLKLFDLYDERNLNPFELSQGQKRRLSTASMMINGQEILILDEPTYGQDIENLSKLLKLLYEVSERGTTVIMITHDLNLVKNSCDKVILLKNGKVEYNGNYIDSLRDIY